MDVGSRLIEDDDDDDDDDEVQGLGLCSVGNFGIRICWIGQCTPGWFRAVVCCKLWPLHTLD